MRLVGYVRVSTADQAKEGISLDAQRARVAAYCEAVGHALVAVEADEGASGKTLSRPGLERALGMLKAGDADGLLITKLDRLTRSIADLYSLIEAYFEERFALVSVSDSIDTKTAAGRLVLNVLISVAQWEREVISERTRDGLAEVKRQGGRAGELPFGARRLDEKDTNGRRVVTPDERETAVISRIRELRADGYTLAEISARLTAEGHRTKRNGKWHLPTIHHILRRSNDEIA